MRLQSLLLLWAGVSCQYHSDGKLVKRGVGHAREISDLNSPLERKVRKKILEKQRLRKRDSGASDGNYAKVDHEDNYRSNDVIYEEMFLHQEDICVAQPEAHEGPYYISNPSVYDPECGDSLYTAEDYVLYLYIEVYNIMGCGLLPDACVQIWGSNSDGYYSGVQSPDNARGLDLRNETFGRGLSRPTDEDDGIAYITTSFPGRTANRTTHISFAIHYNVEMGASTDDDTVNLDYIANSTIVHIGELYFDQDLLDKIANKYPYYDNENLIVRNEDDDQLKLMEGILSPDPFVHYYYDEEFEEVYAWIAIGVDTSNDFHPQVAAQYEYSVLSGEETVTFSVNTSGPITFTDSSYTTMIKDLSLTYSTPSQLTASDIEIFTNPVPLTWSYGYVKHESPTEEFAWGDGYTSGTYSPVYPTQYQGMEANTTVTRYVRNGSSTIKAPVAVFFLLSMLFLSVI